MSYTIPTQWWVGFFVFVIVALIVDILGLEKRGDRAVTTRQALQWSALWVGLSGLFAGLLWHWLSVNASPEVANQKVGEFITGYLIEKSLSVDNIFVFLTIFTAFAVPPEQQKKALVIGVIGAVVLRIVMILIGGWLIAKAHWILYIFGGFLLLTGVKMVIPVESEPDITQNKLLLWLKRHVRITDQYSGSALTVRREGQWWATPLFLVVMTISVTDIIFAVDSIPAIFSVTTDSFIVMTSNIFAILGLRALYFLLAGLADKFHLLKYGLAAILCFIGAKMLLVSFVKIPIGVSLSVIVGILGVAMLASWLTAPKPEA